MTRVAVIGLAVAYISFAFCFKDGMYGIFKTIRDSLPNFKVIHCAFCLSFYLSLLAHWFTGWTGDFQLVYFMDYTDLILSSFASAAIASYGCVQFSMLFKEGN
jgi:hypothetical protein